LELEQGKQRFFCLGNGRKAAKKLIIIIFSYCSTIYVAFWSIEKMEYKGILALDENLNRGFLDYLNFNLFLKKYSPALV
jgi:hypothetical protein